MFGDVLSPTVTTTQVGFGTAFGDARKGVDALRKEGFQGLAVDGGLCRRLWAERREDRETQRLFPETENVRRKTDYIAAINIHWGIKRTPIAMKLNRRSTYTITRPHANFHRIRSPFDAPTVNYSDNIIGLTSDVFGLRKQSSGLPLFSSLSSRPSTQPTTYRQVQTNLSRQPATLLTRTPESCPGPDSGSRHRRVRIIPEHLQNISVFFVWSP